MRRSCLFLALALSTCSLAGAATLRRAAGDEMVAALTDEQMMYLEAPPLRHEGLLALSERLCGDAALAPLISASNRGVTRLLAGVRYRLPYQLLLPVYQRRVVRALFPEDHSESAGWRHHVRPPETRRAESLWRIAEWFTGKGENFAALRDFNGLDDEGIIPGQQVLIPRGLLLPAFLTPPAGSAVGSATSLEYSEDDVGSFAVYRLQKGEALYSSVVVRFTGRIYADDVNRLATEIARRSGISDVTSIPVGYQVKIPLDLLQPEYLPKDHPRRIEYEENLLRSAQFSNPVRSLDLAGVTVILDAGHGGRDVGASVGDVWESTYVYDIMLRVRRQLQSRTAAEVVVTTRDGGSEEVGERDILAPSRGHEVMTTPPYRIHDARVSSNLRWYLANSVFHKAVQRNGDAEKVVFVSIHADSLHPSLRGAMIYLPGLLRTPPNYGKSGRVYVSRQEVKERPRVSLSEQERVRSEGLSRDLAGHVIDSFRNRGLRVHSSNPIRDRIIRKRRAWVPAVLRFNAVPSKVLVEVCNLANPKDRSLIQTRSFREEVAQAIVEGLLSYYGRASSRRSDAVAGGA